MRFGFPGGDLDETFTFDPSKPDAKDYSDYLRLSQNFNLAIKEKRYAEARQLAESVGRHYPTERIKHHLSGFVAYHQGNYTEAIKQFDLLFNRSDGNIKLIDSEEIYSYAMRGASNYQIQNLDAAVKDLEKAYKLGQDNKERLIGEQDAFIQNHLAMTLMKLGRIDEAIGHAEAALEHTPYNTQGHTYLGEILIKNNRLDRAITHLQEAIRIYPANQRAHILLGRALSKQNNPDLAINHLKEAIRIQPNDPAAHIYLAEIYISQKKLPDALTHLQASLNIRPNDWKSHAMMGRVLNMMGRPQEAKTHLETALRHCGNDPNIQANLQDMIKNLNDGRNQP